MHDDFSSTAWVDGSPAFYQDITDALAKARVAFERLAAIEFAAPWEKVRSDKKGARTTC